MARLIDVAFDFRKWKPGERKTYTMNPIPTPEEVEVMIEAITQQRPELGRLEVTLFTDKLIIVSTPLPEEAP